MAKQLKIAIAGNKGGVGKTFVAVNLFTVANSKREKACTLVDAHIQVPGLYHYFKSLEQKEVIAVQRRIPEIDPNACTFCGRCVHYCAYDAILMLKESKHIKVLDDYCTSCGACVYACNDGAISERDEDLGRVSIFQLPHGKFIEGRMYAIRPLASPVIQKINEVLQEEDCVIVDTPPGNSYPFAEAVRDAAFVVLLAEMGRGGMQNLKDNISILKSMNLAFGVLINKALKNTNEIKNYLDEHEIILLDEIPFDLEIARLHAAGEIVVEHKTEYRELFEGLMQEIEKQLKGGQG